MPESSSVTVSGVHDLPNLSGTDAVLSIRDPGDDRPAELESLEVPVFDLVFHDVSDEPDDLDVQPEAWQLERLLRFLNEFRPARVHVYCFYGVSRSTALASLVVAHQTPDLSDDAVVSRVLKARPQAHPNGVLLALIDDVLARDLTGAWARRTVHY